MLPGKTAIVGMALCGVTLFGAGTTHAQFDVPKDSTVVEKRDTFRSGKATINVLHFRKPGVGKRPAVVILHGCDGWEQLAAYRYVARSLAGGNQDVVLIRYFDRTNTPDAVTSAIRDQFRDWLVRGAPRDVPNAARDHFGLWIETAGDAVRYVRTLPNVDESRVGLVGVSLGGFLAVSAAANKELKVAALVTLFAGAPEERRKGLTALPPTLVLHGEEDELIPVKEAHALIGLLQQRKLHVESEIYPGLGHGLIPTGKDRPDPLAVLRAMARIKGFVDKKLSASVATTALP